MLLRKPGHYVRSIPISPGCFHVPDNPVSWFGNPLDGEVLSDHAASARSPARFDCAGTRGNNWPLAGIIHH